MENLPILAIIVPCFNEDTVLNVTSKSLSNIIESLIDNNKISDTSFLCFIDDGSYDNTWKLIEDLNKQNHINKGLKLSRNFGHQNALIAGLFTIEADIYITIDADLQDDESIIPKMIDEYLNGSHIVFAVRESRKADSLFKRVTAQSFYLLMNLMKTKTLYNHADYRLMSKKVVKNLEHYEEVNLFLRGIITLVGFPSSIVYYDRKKRFSGESKFNLFKMITFALDGITSFSIFPLRIITFFGFFTCLISILFGIWAIYLKIIGNVIPGWSSIVIPMYFLGGVQIMSLGIIGEYIGKVYKEVKKRPRFIIEKEIK
ncbi:MAG: glycosyltransferase family 2 protein [Cyanobacteriota bacterium]